MGRTRRALSGPCRAPPRRCAGARHPPHLDRRRHHAIALNVGRPLLSSRGAREATFPELYYTVTIKRDLFVPFMTYLFPVLITAIMLFFGLMITTKELDRRSQISWNVANVLSYCAALLFVALLAHIKMRCAVGAEGAASYSTTLRCDGV
jgi:hypothetical protein